MSGFEFWMACLADITKHAAAIFQTALGAVLGGGLALLGVLIANRHSGRVSRETRENDNRTRFHDKRFLLFAEILDVVNKWSVAAYVEAKTPMPDSDFTAERKRQRQEQIGRASALSSQVQLVGPESIASVASQLVALACTIDIQLSGFGADSSVTDDLEKVRVELSKLKKLMAHELSS